METFFKQLAIDIFKIAKTHSEIIHCLDGKAETPCAIDYVTDTILELFKDSEMIKPFIGDSGIPYDEFVGIPDETDQSLREYIWVMVDDEM